MSPAQRRRLPDPVIPEGVPWRAMRGGKKEPDGDALTRRERWSRGHPDPFRPQSLRGVR